MMPVHICASCKGTSRPGETVRLIIRFTDFADPMTPYMYHCHLLNHEDNGMMGQFVVV
ncbi:MAG TPA: multicopper oxidase domain-containing protein [Ilumatobacteraceae bacterium]|jgi:FtsP/CotA-like multicopper oxidase with cupredoxin domain